MLSQKQLDIIWSKAKFVTLQFPESYQNLMGVERLAVLHLLDEPVQSVLHQIVQQNVAAGTPCLQPCCSGTLDKRGQCSLDCTQMGINLVDDIICCRNCDAYGFPCSTCQCNIFHNQLVNY